MSASDENDGAPKLTRRQVISLPVIVGVGAGLASTACGASIPGQAVAFGPPDQLEAGPQRLEGYDVFVVRSDQGVAAISGQCTHAGCGVAPSDDGGFRCGCHGSTFTADGTVTSGPATENLTWYAVRMEDGEVVVDPTQTVPQGTYTPL